MARGTAGRSGRASAAQRRVLAAGALAMAGVAAGPAAAADCRLALVLALDVSISVDEAEERLQREGLARALRAPAVAGAFLAGDPVAVFAFEWSHAGAQTPLTPGWVLVEAPADLDRIARAVTAGGGRPSPGDFTAVGAALAFAGRALERAPPCRDRLVDLSGDGRGNDGPAPETAYAAPAFAGVTVNALIVSGPEDDDRLVAWFEAHVLRGPGAFWLMADGFEDFERAMTAKLLRELAPRLAAGGRGGAARL